MLWTLGRALIIATLLAGGWALAEPLATANSQSIFNPPPAGVSGRLVIPRNRDLFEIAATSGAEQRLLGGASLTSITQASWAPDGRRIAYSLFRFWRPDRPAGSDLQVVEASGGDPITVLPADGEDTSFTEPVWTADGTGLIYSAVVRVPESRLGETTNQIERVSATGGPRQVLVGDGFSPALSRDGREMAFLRAGPPLSGGDVTLWIADATGGNPRLVLSDRRFDSLAFPRLAPGGDRVAFVGVGGPAPARRAPGRLLSLAPRVHAHGLPWDLWEVRLDGSGLRRLTELAEDDPSIAWSPDGRWIAFQGGTGLYLIDAATADAHHLNDVVAFGGIDWTP